jgi:protein-S-isoprenylcysteine O-methyltransferase Ste14
MKTPGHLRTASLLVLAVVFTAGLTFATVELPGVVDRIVQNTVTTPGWDSHADAVARLKTDFFMAHYHVRAIGYIAFFLVVGLIVAGFSTKRTGLAALGAFGVMLPVFAQFAGVMFFLAGLGILNLVWLPLLDVSYELQHWGLVINAPNDALRWLLGLAGIRSVWPVTLFFIGSGILIFLLGVYAWLIARAHGSAVARFSVYRLSRHPQYLGWILWTYGAYLLLQQMHYPRRSWGIGASLPWLISTMVIVCVALLEELGMRKRHGEAYDAYRGSAPFLFPLPHAVERLLGAPFRLLFAKDRPDRNGEVVAVVGVYTVALMALSAFLYAGGVSGTIARFGPAEVRTARMNDLVRAISRTHEYRQQYRLMTQLVSYGQAAVEPILGLLEGNNPGLRVLAAEGLQQLRSERAVPALSSAVSNSDENLRYRAAEALGAVRTKAALPALLPLLDDPVIHIRVRALNHLSALGASEVLARAPVFLADSREWVRVGGVVALGTLGEEEGVALLTRGLTDPSPQVRREAAVALARIGSPSGRGALERALGDDDWEVRVYAAEALKRLPRVAS